MKKLISLILSLTMLLSITAGLDLTAFAATESGTCGANLTWKFNTKTGKLTISGKGDMYDYGDGGDVDNYDIVPSWLNSDVIDVISVKISKGVTSIGNHAFSYCRKMTSVTIPNSVTSIGDYAFSYCKKLTSVTISDSVTSIGEEAFHKCTSLTSVTIPESVTSIGYGAFSGCTSLLSISIGSNVTSIGGSAFYNTAYYKNVSNWEDNALYIGNYLIKAKTSLSGDYTVKNGTVLIAGYAFYDCESLTSVTIPDSVISIGDSAFYDCASLTGITIPDSVTSMGYGTFSGCTSLTSVTIGDSVKSIGATAFSDTAFYKNSSNWTGKVLYIGKYLIEAKTSLNGKYEIKSGTIAIAEGAFNNCKKITSVTIPNTVTSIDDDVFYGCKSLTGITIPNSVTSIGGYAFYNCESLTSVTIPNAVTNISEYAFYGCALTSITIPKSVTRIEAYAFGSCDLKKVKIGKNVAYIDDDAFYCKSLTSFSVSSKNSYYSSANGVLFDKDKKILIAYPIAKKAKSYSIPKTVATIGMSAFSRCENLTTVTIPTSVKNIEYCAFYGCKNLQKVNYKGKKSAWKKLNITGRTTDSNGCLTYATVLCSDGYQNIMPTYINKITEGTKQFTITWRKVSDASGYQIQYTTDSYFKKNLKTVTVPGVNSTSRTIKYLSSKKTYYVRIRSYKTVNGKKIYSSWQGNGWMNDLYDEYYEYYPAGVYLTTK